MRLEIRGEYTDDWPEIADQTRAEAGNRCVRCKHPDPPDFRPRGMAPCDVQCRHSSSLTSMTIFPVMADVTASAEAQEIVEGVGLAIALQPEDAERHDVGDGQLLGQASLLLPTVTAGIEVTSPGVRFLRAPIRAIILNTPTFPVRTPRSNKVAGKPGHSARVATETLPSLARADFSLLAAYLTAVNHSTSLAGLGTMTPTNHPGGWTSKEHRAFRAWLRNGHEEIYHINGGKQRILTCHHLDGDKANVRWWNLLALCQVCHLQIQAKLIPERPWLWEHSGWFKVYAAGFYAHYYGDFDVTRVEAEARLDELLLLGQPWRVGS